MKDDGQVAHPAVKPLMIFDGDCGFCRRWIARWQEHTGDRVDYLPLQDPQLAERFPEIAREQLQQSVHFIEQDGRVSSGARAVFRALAQAPGKRWLWWLYNRVPGAAPVTELCYRQVARNRAVGSFLTRMLWGDHVERPQYRIASALFLSALGLVYLFAFLSMLTQVEGLLGRNGIQPAAQFMANAREYVAREHIGLRRYWLLPTLCWLGASDVFLKTICWAGIAFSVLAIAGAAPVIALPILWLLYLSLATVNGIFLGYQWDALLLETGLLAIFLAPWQLVPRWWARRAAPPGWALWMLRLLLFKLMFCSGIVKLSSGDPVWRNLTALTFHYETQPLPTWVAWYAHQLPVWFHKLSCAVMFGIELAAPFLIFTPRRPRQFGCAAIVFLQMLIILTGNYCFFNLLTVVLCILLLDDTTLRSLFRIRGDTSPTPFAAQRRWPVCFLGALAGVYAVLSLMLIVGSFRADVTWPRALTTFYGWVAPLRSCNSYGLFAVMTTSRPEIIIEGSDDGLTWREYEFQYKPGDLHRRPRFVAPHQPRVDWQMWFAALGRYENNPWFIDFCYRLLQGSPEVLALLKTNPFPESPPHYLRAWVYDYHFTDFATRRVDGTWWRRDRRGLYCPVMSLPNP